MRPSCSSPRRVLARLAVPVVLTLGAVAGCGGSSPTPAAPPSAAPSPAGSSPAAPPPAGSSPAAAPATTVGPGSAPGAAAGTGAGRACTAGQVSLAVIGTNGAAGTLVDAVRLTNRGTAACTVTGYVDLAVVDLDGHRLPARVRHGAPLPAVLAAAPVPVALRVGEWAWFALAFHDVPTAGCAAPPQGAALAVALPGGGGAATLDLHTAATCGEFGVSAVRPASAWRPADWATP